MSGCSSDLNRVRKPNYFATNSSPKSSPNMEEDVISGLYKSALFVAVSITQ